ncbi:DEAD/DEAH box helicase [Noviherbaspirillum sedimenti]|uniref:DNA 3'-5' helicase II n=1 Tax=Noviherbaspirillum sedimenti TaxID=2320865 RepID=A0A3A3G7Z8_9BURK|nr:nuclease-related domain-containing DEAD/DEAH box helicase [Noviherbaspirillum sedimenti]RJG02879.1 DNA helicase II [Noviherbaspirillum sedimenti]
MATLIPAIGACKSRMTGGERRLAERFEEKFEDDYLCWYDVSIGDKTRHPDFVVFHPSRGLLVLEVKDWKLTTIQSIDKQSVVLSTDHGLKHELNPLEQARQYMYVITSKLERDPQLVWPSGSLKGKPAFPYGHGVVLANIDRKQFDEHNMENVLPSHLVICKDEMTPSVDAEAFQKRLWDMFPYKFTRKLSLPQIDRIRWHMFPEIRIPAQADMFADSGQKEIEIPDVLRVMDIQQEQLARSLGEGHRVIHGVAGSGKTLILGYRAEHLAKMCQRPILVLCYNKTLAAKLASTLAAKGLQDKVNVVNFHAWCVRQLKAYNVGTPPNDSGIDAFFEACVDKVIRSVDQKLIPSAQYDAVLIDEGHDFKAEWFKLVVQMIHPDTNSLLVLYDDAQSIYNGPEKRRFSFSSVGVQAQGRTTILKLNYRNTAEILAVARAFADDLLSAKDTEEDQAPIVQPMSTGRHGPKPLLIKFPKLSSEIEYLADRLASANKMGMPWNQMAVIYRHYGIGKEVAQLLSRKGVPFEWQQDKKKSFDPNHDSVKIVTMHSSKGLEFPVVCIPGVGATGPNAESAEEEARLLYVAMTRATHELVMTHGEESVIAEKMGKAMGALDTI